MATARSRGRRSRSRTWAARRSTRTATEKALADGASIEDAAALAAEGTEPSSDHAASADFRRHLARVLTRRALEEAAAR